MKTGLFLGEGRLMLLSPLNKNKIGVTSDKKKMLLLDSSIVFYLFSIERSINSSVSLFSCFDFIMSDVLIEVGAYYLNKLEDEQKQIPLGPPTSTTDNNDDTSSAMTKTNLPRSSSGAVGEPPNAYTCPITYDLMRDPVLLGNTGHTYERVAIESWLRNHNTDPLTNKSLISSELIPNKALGRAIKRHVLREGGTWPLPPIELKPPARGSDHGDDMSSMLRLFREFHDDTRQRNIFASMQALSFAVFRDFTARDADVNPLTIGNSNNRSTLSLSRIERELRSLGVASWDRVQGYRMVDNDDAVLEAVSSMFNSYDTDGERDSHRDSARNPTVEEEALDEEDLNPRDIAIVIEQARCSRNDAIRALRSENNDVVNAIMLLTI